MTTLKNSTTDSTQHGRTATRLNTRVGLATGRRALRTTGRWSRRGAALVETALVLPIFLMLIFGIIEFGRALMVSNMVTNAAREGARIAILDGSSNTEVTAAVREFLTSSLGVDTNSVDVDIEIVAAEGNPNPGTEVGNCESRDLITVSVTIPFSEVSLLPGDFIQATNLVGRAAMRHE